MARDTESELLLLALKKIDQSDEIDVTPWEADFIDSVMKWPHGLSERQKSIIWDMCDHYGVKV